MDEARIDVGAVLRARAHRPFPLPDRPWLAQQQWLDLLFAHWRVDPAGVAGHVPAPLVLDVADGAGWVGVVPFRLRGLRARSLPGVPTATDFLELNVRTYVTHDGRPGVYFFSLDASSALAVLGARTLFGLPYHEARMRAWSRDGWTEYESEREGAADVAFRGRYRPEGDVFTAAPGTLDHFLTERYCLFTVRGQQVSRVDIHHPPWRLQRARAELRENGMARPLGLALAAVPDRLHYSARQEMVNWAPVAAR